MALLIIKSLNNNPLAFGSGRIMKVSLIISFFFHAIILMSFHKAIPLYWPIEELRTYRVEMIRPPIEDINTDDIPKTNIERLKEKEQLNPEGVQDTISLDTKDKRYITYSRLIKPLPPRCKPAVAFTVVACCIRPATPVSQGVCEQRWMHPIGSGSVSAVPETAVGAGTRHRQCAFSAARSTSGSS